MVEWAAVLGYGDLILSCGCASPELGILYFKSCGSAIRGTSFVFQIPCCFGYYLGESIYISEDK